MSNVEIVVSTLNPGGISNVVKGFARNLQNSGDLSRVISLQDGIPANSDAFRTFSLNISGSSSNWRKITVALRRIIKYFLIKKFNTASIHFCMDPSSLLISYSANFFKKHTYVAWCATPKELLVMSDRLIIKFLYHRAKVVIVPSETLKRDLQQINSRANVEVVPNPITYSEISCTWPRNSESTKSDVLYLGRFSPEKGVSILPKLAFLNPDISFVLVGSGPLQDSLEREKESSNIRNLKFVSWADSRKYLQDCNLLILPSIYESFGLVVIESWLYGKPIVAAQIASGPAGLINKHGGGSLVTNYEDLGEWGALIRKNLEVELADEFISKILETYSAENIVKIWLNFADQEL